MLIVNYMREEGEIMIDIDLDNSDEVTIYKAFNVDGNEAEALNDSYLELYELIGRADVFWVISSGLFCQALTEEEKMGSERRIR